jgi:hypothetical protein
MRLALNNALSPVLANMASVYDSWFIRLPDGRVVLAKSTRAVRHHIESGRIPPTSHVRRSPHEDWQKLEGIPDFAALLLAPSSRDLPGGDKVPAMARSGAEFRALGVRGLVNELFNAVDSSLHRFKLWIACGTSLVWAVGYLALALLPPTTDLLWLMMFQAAIGLSLLFVAGLASGILGQMTVVEISRFRPAQWHEVRPGVVGKAVKITLAQALILGMVLLPLWGLHHSMDVWAWFFGSHLPPILQGTFLGLRLLLEIIFWPLAGMSLLLGPLILVEECSPWRGLAEWFDLLRTDLSRIFLYETLAFALGTVLTFPLIFPILYAGWKFSLVTDYFLSAVGLATLHVLGGLALTPLVAFLLVANVFIYLNLRYEFLFPRGK